MMATMFPELVHAVEALTLVLTSASVDDVPEPEDVKAGWTAFAMFLIGCAAVALIGWSLYRKLKGADERREARARGELDEPEWNRPDEPR